MAQVKRESANKTSDISGGPYLAKIISHLDPTFMGGLEVTLLRPDGNSIGDGGQTYGVRYASPFAGQTAFEFQGSNVDDFNDTQKSYGFWFVPPDVGNTVLVFFIEGDPSQGYWLGCVPDKFSNHMVPGIAASRSVAFAEGEQEKYDTGFVPVAEANRRANSLEENTEIDKIKRAVHPIADHFLEEGLLEDDVRGVTYSTSRRNVPSSVYGISTPGPLDRRSGAKKTFIGKSDSQSPVPVPVSRLGGSQFVMDDGDDRYQRRTTAGEGGYDYADTLDGDAGEPTIPSDEYIRLRTRTGHQLLLHTSEDLIYIGNSRGTSWIEMTSDGKIDIFAEDSISIHTKQDFNFYADRDFNIEVGRNFNLKVAERHQTEVGTDKILLVDGNNNIIVVGNRDTTIEGNETDSFVGDFNTVVGGSTLITTAGDYDNNTAGAIKLMAGGDTDINVGGDMKMTSGGDASLGGANITMTGGAINLNGPAAPTAAEATPATPATPPEALPVFENVVVDPAQADWIGDRYDPGSPLESIMKRIPMHEPWPNHENLDPLSVKPDITDREA
jgi:hypothetical protein